MRLEKGRWGVKGETKTKKKERENLLAFEAFILIKCKSFGAFFLIENIELEKAVLFRPYSNFLTELK